MTRKAVKKPYTGILRTTPVAIRQQPKHNATAPTDTGTLRTAIVATLRRSACAVVGLIGATSFHLAAMLA